MTHHVGVGRQHIALTMILIAFTVGAFLTISHNSHEKVGKAFPGYLSFENDVVGAFYLPGWPGARDGRLYHDRIGSDAPNTAIFSEQDYALTVILPALSGLLFMLLGAGIFLYLPSRAGSLPLLIFHFLVGSYLILSPDFHLTHHFSYLLLGFFAFIPATIIHFALFFPEVSRIILKFKRAFIVPYIVSAVLCIPYIYYFKRNPALWIHIEHAMVYYLAGTYLFWLIRLAVTLKRPLLKINRIIARYLLFGQIIAFTIPLAAAIAIFITNTPVPLNLAAPIILLFPASLFIGTLMGRLRQSQMQLVMIERRAAVGNLMAGLAHELNNPMTFIYSNLEPFEELLDKLQLSSKDTSQDTVKDLRELHKDLSEGATRAKAILDNFREFSHPGENKMQSTQIKELLDQSITILTPKWRNRININRQFSESMTVKCVPEELCQVFVNLIANACDAIEDTGEISISTEQNGSKVCIRIGDSGCGIPKDVLPRIFDPFVTLKNPGEGTGLGLALSLDIVKRHHGSIEVSSEEGKGTVFFIILHGESS